MSVDVPVGNPYNIAQYALLTHLLAHVTDMEAGKLVWVGGDTHIYLDQLEGVEEQIKREPLALPTIWINPEVKDLFKIKFEDIKILNYQHHPHINYPVST